MPPETPDRIRADAFLCDGVQEVGGKLFALGIGWNTIGSTQYPVRHARFGVGVVIHVPYGATNQVHAFELHLEDEDGQTVPLGEALPGTDPAMLENGRVVRVGGQFNVGRPPDLPAGDEQVIPIAMQLDGIEFPHTGAYAAVVMIDGSEVARQVFRMRLM